jgi:hypothetical protein
MKVTTLYNSEGRKKQAANHAIVIDLPLKTSDGSVIKGTQIVGQMTNEFQLDMNAQWEELINMNGLFKAGETVMQLLGSPAFASGIFTRKFFKGGSHLIFNTEFRIVDYDGDGRVVKSLRSLVDVISPLATTDAVSTAATNLVDLGETLFGEGLIQAGKDLAAKLGRVGVGPVRVMIGNYYSDYLIIESISCKYSKEQTPSGPLYADFTVRFSTQEIVPKGGVSKRLRDSSGNSRITSEG